MDFKWSKSEKEIAKKVFNLAKQRDYKNLLESINDKAIKTPDDIWNLQNLLNEKAKEFDEKYDYRYSQLIILFVRLINEDLLKIEELNGLATDKINLIQKITEL